MKRSHFAYLSIAILCSVAGIFIIRAHAQTLASGAQPASKFALQISDCPTATAGYMLCPVVPLNGQPFLAMSVAGYNAGAPFQLASQGVPGPKGDKGDSITGPTGATGATGPAGPVQSFGTMACPSTSSPLSVSGGMVFGPGCKETNP